MEFAQDKGPAQMNRQERAPSPLSFNDKANITNSRRL
jgi:hypothetical protein